ncbi:peroxisome membrane protein [Endogone sp. FLAS-F59071]|nr:peroxisome membrane protein [Endogone sp. FLAS-F59071]|eukprot:RUS15891.1 peroxisome membrane protein [Endogone sp. FLAS-F59071]
MATLPQTHHHRSVLSLLGSPAVDLLRKYDDFLIKNASQITAIESTLRSLTYILPGRFEDAEFASQALFALLNLLGLYHDSILHRAATAFASTSPAAAAALPPPPAFNRYTRHWYQSSKLYRRIAMLLTLISYTEVLVEMGVQKKWGKRAKWKLVTAVEGVICRLILIHISQDRTLLYPPHPERDIDPSTLQAHSQAVLSGTPDPDTWTGQRTHTVRPHLSATIQIGEKACADGYHTNGFGGINRNGTAKHADVTEFLLSKVLTPDHLKRPQDLVHVLKGLGKAGEYIFLLRPFIYVLAINHYGRRSWYPWLLSFSLELASRTAIRNYFSSKHDPFRNNMSQLEREETSRRLWLLLFYVLKDPFYERFTSRRIIMMTCATPQSNIKMGWFRYMEVEKEKKRLSCCW